MIQDAVVRNLEIIGEAVKGLSETSRLPLLRGKMANLISK